ncbi:MAG: phosphoribosylformylglycinamidine synthase subunit PurQ [Coriobacteriia bacterium]|nr:phosphoribosylformylglycinamidine synthase subunit PurQ [Coriobacteriia bacterium]
MRFGVVVFPGSNCEQDVVHSCRHLGLEADYVWHGDTDLTGFDAVVLPGGFSYGDYIRTGAVARFSPVMAEVVRFAERGGPVMGVCNGFQILTEAHMLPGALIRNTGLKFICHGQPLVVQDSVCEWLDLPAGTVVDIPVNHNEGNYVCDPRTLERLRAERRVVLRYCGPEGVVSDDSAPNGATWQIAGICNERGNVFGLMPHPERRVDPAQAPDTDGQAFFTAIARRLAEVAG